MNDIDRIITDLERQKVAIERAISALRDISGRRASGAKQRTQQPVAGSAKRRISPEGRKRIAEAARRRWAAKRAAEAQQALTTEDQAPTKKPRQKRAKRAGSK